MKILITVGTTPFDKLIRYCDEKLNESLMITMQISNNARYIPKRFAYFRFANNIISYYTSADLVITHAGAGSIFTLLEMKKRIIVIPNLERDDHHQNDLANIVSSKQWGLVCWNYEDLPSLIERSIKFPLVPYERKEFFGGQFLDELIKQTYFTIDG